MSYCWGSHWPLPALWRFSCPSRWVYWAGCRGTRVCWRTGTGRRGSAAARRLACGSAGSRIRTVPARRGSSYWTHDCPSHCCCRSDHHNPWRNYGPRVPSHRSWWMKTRKTVGFNGFGFGIRNRRLKTTKQRPPCWIWRALMT